MNSPKNNLIVAVALSLLVVGWFFYKGSFGGTSAPGENIGREDAGLKTYDSATLPPGIPSDLPNISLSSSVVANTSDTYRIAGPDSDGVAAQQSVRKFYAPGSLADNVNAYKVYLENKGFAVEDTTTTTRVVLVGKKGSESLSIVITKEKDSRISVSIISISIKQ